MEYEIKGTPLPVAICHLKKGESLICDSGAMSWMDPCMEMKTTSNGGIGKAFGRMFSGETIFQNRYTANDDGLIAFASSFPGKILPYDVSGGKDIVIQKSSFLACEEGVDVSVFFNKKLSSGLFGGEGFIMNKISGDGIVFLEIDGETVEYDLAPGQQMIIDTGYLAMMDATCSIEVKSVSGLKNKFLGREGWFNTVVTGPGRIVLQTMPVSTLASNIINFLPANK
ncbi:MAG: TIGR00266 family protein [Coprobacillaceae bacterium]